MSYLRFIHHIERCDKCKNITHIQRRNHSAMQTITLYTFYPVAISILILLGMSVGFELVKFG